MTYRKQAKRTTVSIDHVVWTLAQENMALRGFNGNFSAYVADLIRRDLDALTPEQRLTLREADQKENSKNKKG